MKARPLTSTALRAPLVIAATLGVVLLARFLPSVSDRQQTGSQSLSSGNGTEPNHPPSAGDVMVARYPLVSVAPRLEYESKRSGAESSNDLTPGILEGLREQDALFDSWSDRRYLLGMFHSEARHTFDEAQGFGLGRIVVAPNELNLPPIASPPAKPLDSFGYAPLASTDELPEFLVMNIRHEQARTSFLLPASLGYVRDREHVAGFVPHAFRRSLSPDLPTPTGRAQWNMSRLQLVSLLKFDTPRVYEMAGFPDMTRLDAAPTRALNDFESDSLPRLATREDVVIEERGNRIHMLGSLRASSGCLKCHDVPRGTLLGAFSYVFRRISAGDGPQTALPLR